MRAIRRMIDGLLGSPSDSPPLTFSPQEWDDLLARVHSAQAEGRDDRAIALLQAGMDQTEKEAAATGEPVFLRPYAWLAELHHEAGDADAEREVLERLAEHAPPDDDEAEALLERLADLRP